jgi:proteasome lid subunit RPN8/RPN11
VKKRFALTVSQDVPSAALTAAGRVLKKIFVRIVNKNWRLKMKNGKTEVQEQKKTQIQNQPKQQSRKSSLQAEHKKRLALRFSPTAWAKLLYFRDKSDNEVGGFAITEPNDLLFVKDFVTVKQEVTSVSVKFDDAAVADFFDAQVDIGRKPEQFARIWLHTHPADSPEPSMTDEETFLRVFSSCQWAVMFIVAQNNKAYARISFNVGPGGQILIPTEIDYGCDFGQSDHEAWDSEYQANIQAVTWPVSYDKHFQTDQDDKNPLLSEQSFDLIRELEKIDPVQRQLILDELAERPDLWGDEEEVMFYDY